MFRSAVQRAAYSSTWIEFIQTCVRQCLKRLWRCCGQCRCRWCRLLFGWVLIEWCHWQAPSISHHAGACASCTLGTKLFVFISIQCFFNVFISKVPSCVCQLQWKARDTTECGSRFNRFHAICAALRGICLPLGEGRLSHSGGFSRAAGLTPTLPVLRMEGTDAAEFCSKHSSFSTCARPQHGYFVFLLEDRRPTRSRWGEVQFTRSGVAWCVPGCTHAPAGLRQW